VFPGRTPTHPFEDYETRTAAARKAANAERAKAELELLPKFGTHDARHTYGAMLRAAGVRESDISDFLRHSRPGGVTVSYTSVLEADARDADAMALFAGYPARVNSADRIEQMSTAVDSAADRDVGDLARALVERFGEGPTATIVTNVTGTVFQPTQVVAYSTTLALVSTAGRCSPRPGPRPLLRIALSRRGRRART
jgi:hypothetical protein